jgi:osmotically-inducible protein OsmY
MQKQLKAALSWDPLLDGPAIDVAVLNRAAYLSGAVDSSLQKTEAHDAASRIKGVVLVRNHLKVEPGFSICYYDWPFYRLSPYYVSETSEPQAYQSDEQIKKNIENAFFWSPFVHSDDITVSVDGGVATLTGTVGSWIAYGEADKDAHESGATVVRDHLNVK